MAKENSMKWVKNFFADLRDDKFHAAALVASLILFVYVGFFTTPADMFQADENAYELYYTNGCPHCAAANEFLDAAAAEYPTVKVGRYELSTANADRRQAFLAFVKENNIVGVPVLKKGDVYLAGFDEKAYRDMLDGKITQSASYASCAIGEGGDCAVVEKEVSADDLARLMSGEVKRPSRIVNLPVFGAIDVYQESIPVLAVVLGLVDGFNPCAMWVLIFMISVIADLHDKRKTIVIVGSFLAASAVFYFALMAGWINLFLIIGYMRILTVALGAIAVYSGAMSLRSFFDGNAVCKVTSPEGRAKIKDRIRELAEKPLSWATLTGVFLLAVVVNGIEFVCSAALPAIFTNVLAMSHLSTFMHYFYISVYMLFFMLDDIIVFSLAAFAVNKYAGDKYMIWCKLIGGVILLGLGLVMLFRPEMMA